MKTTPLAYRQFRSTDIICEDCKNQIVTSPGVTFNEIQFEDIRDLKWYPKNCSKCGLSFIFPQATILLGITWAKVSIVFADKKVAEFTIGDDLSPLKAIHNIINEYKSTYPDLVINPVEWATLQRR